MDENQTQDHRIKNVDLTSMMRSSFWITQCQLLLHVLYLMFVMA